MPYVNFPHQVNQIEKLRQMLSVAKELVDAGKGLDDETFGYEMLNQGLIRLRSKKSITQLKSLPADRQSPIITARDINRTFRLLGYIEKYRNTFYLTNRGRKLVGLIQQSVAINDEEKDVWIESLLNLKFHSANDSPTTSKEFRIRPVRLMLELLHQRPLETKYLVFALTVTDESNTSIRKIKRMISKIMHARSTFLNETTKVGLTESNAKNNIKILPSLCIQLGLVSRNKNLLMLTQEGLDIFQQERTRNPIWYEDLHSDEKLRPCITAILLLLNNGAVGKAQIDGIIKRFGFSSTMILNIIRKKFRLNFSEGKISLVNPISFDLYQDIPPEVRHKIPLSTLIHTIETGMVKQDIRIKAPRQRYRKQRVNLPIVHRSRDKNFRVLTDKRQLKKTYTVSPLTAEKETQRQLLIEKRSNEHDALVGKVMDIFKRSRSGFKLSDHKFSFDLLAEKKDYAILHEMKTVNPSNEGKQIREALGQLFYYEWFYFPDALMNKRAKVIKVIVLSNEPTDKEHIDFLRDLDVLVLWMGDDKLQGEPESLYTYFSLLSK